MNFKAAVLIARKDLSIELRSKHSISFMFLFSFMALLLFNFAADRYSQSVRDVAPGFLWFIIVFTGLLGISRAFVREEEAGTLDALKLSPISADDILFGKVLYNLVLMLLVELIAFPLFVVLFDYAVAGSVADVLAILTLGGIGLVVVGSFISAVVISARSRELLLQVVVLPLLLPIIVPVMMSLKEVMILARPLLELPELRLILFYIVVMTTLSSLLFSYVMEE